MTGQGVWKVELLSKWASEDAGVLSVLQALGGSIPEQLPIAEFMTRSEVYFANGGVRLGLRERLLARNAGPNTIAYDPIPYASEQGI